jgi:hypothetical protein
MQKVIHLLWLIPAALIALIWYMGLRARRQFDVHCIAHTPKGYRPRGDRA